MRRWVPPAVGLLAVAALGGCGDGRGGDRPASPSGPAATSAPTTSTTTTTAPPAAGFGVEGVDVKGGQRGLLTGVTATADAGSGVDVITFTFQGGLPGYRVGYVERPIQQDGSGEEVKVAGDGVIEVRFAPASGYDLSGGGHAVYTGPDRLAEPTTTVVKDVVRTGDFEGVLRWAVGVSAKPVFRVRTESNPSRVVVEVRR